VLERPQCWCRGTTVSGSEFQILWGGNRTSSVVDDGKFEIRYFQAAIGAGRAECSSTRYVSDTSEWSLVSRCDTWDYRNIGLRLHHRPSWFVRRNRLQIGFVKPVSDSPNWLRETGKSLTGLTLVWQIDNTQSHCTEHLFVIWSSDHVATVVTDVNMNNGWWLIYTSLCLGHILSNVLVCGLLITRRIKSYWKKCSIDLREWLKVFR